MKFFNSLDIRNVLTGGVLNLFNGWKNNFKVVRDFKVVLLLIIFFYARSASSNPPCYSVDLSGSQEIKDRCGEHTYYSLVKIEQVCRVDGRIIRSYDRNSSQCDLCVGQVCSTAGDKTDEWMIWSLRFPSWECGQEGSQNILADENCYYACFLPITSPPPPSQCNITCPEHYVLDSYNCVCICGYTEETVDECHYVDESCEYKDYQFQVNKRVEVDCEERDSYGRPLVKLILQERKWRPGWTDAVYRRDNDISNCISNQVMGKAIEVWEYGDCGGGVPKPDIYRGTFRYPDQMEMYLGKGKCNYYLNVNWDDPDLWWFTPINFSVECSGDCILQGPSEEEVPPVE